VLNALGVAYAFGRGTEEDEELAYQYFESAAKLGSEEAKVYLNNINSTGHANGQSVKRKKEIDPFYQNLTEKIRDAAAKDLREILSQVGDEHIYAAALVTDSNCVTLFLAVNTIEYLVANEDPDIETKWMPDEWGYSDADNSQLSKLSKSLWQHYSNLPSESFFIDAVISAMKQLRDAGVFGKHTEGLTCFVSMSDDDNAENIENESAIRLNPPSIAATFLDRER
ncbi:MAG: DUF4303 domain-containing protein, partial [Duncaniella sp.]|nr:DUF4303 domain-containing protein [Duncaniella sp.]